MADQQRTLKDDPFLLKFSPEELRIASEFLSNWLPFLSRDLCHSCTQTLSDRVRSIHPVAIRDAEHDGSTCLNGCSGDQANWDAHSVGSWKDGADLNDTADTNSLGSWKDGADGSPEPVAEVSMESGPSVNLKDALPQTSVEASTSDTFSTPVSDSRKVKMSWADMAQEDELEAEEETESTGSSRQLGNGDGFAGEGTAEKNFKPKTELSREQREHIRFSNVKRKKDFICLERVNGKIVNILDGLELHTGVFSAAEQIRIVNYVETLQEMGKKGQLKGRTYTAPQKWMRGKGRVTIQFGCCYNYATDKNGNPPGIIRDDSVDPIPQLFKVMIKRLVKWHVMPPNCVPDSCIVNIYDEGDCIPPHIDNHDFVRPFCTVSFISECNIVFGSNLSVVGPGEFAGAIAIPLPVGSVLVINGNSADVAKHCVPSVPTKRISITFRRMDESKRPVGFVPEPDLQGLEPLSYEADRSRKSKDVYSRRSMRKQAVRREENMDKLKGSAERSSEPRYSGRNRQRPVNRGRTEG
ncbi:RNA demethylase ALKBH9B-like isoform X1 [Ipomoea triloba]|uniref:RNA demethylase ALKBH9B-like isoform X1 n=1 Tax=Ipomoea triloba TaxID=35885 RepID=UPI00125D0EDA|nr:RNA demethylase ALKBH9B-like isoform X1 [Ipomoea triloba]